MKKDICLSILLIILAGSLYSQNSVVTHEINEQVWKPFIKSFATGDEAGFRAVHSKDVTRVIQDDNQVLGYDQYFKMVPDSVKAKWGNWKKNIELRFIQRISGNDRAFEVGYYKTTSTNTQTGEIRTGIGMFHVLLRKENGVWKILMDADTKEGAGEEVFSKAKPME